MKNWYECQHVWLAVESDNDWEYTEDSVRCTICGVHGERNSDGTIFYPAT